MADVGLPDDWRYCQHKEIICRGCSKGREGMQVVERKVTTWVSPEHWHATCALERALRYVIRYKWTPKEPTR